MGALLKQAPQDAVNTHPISLTYFPAILLPDPPPMLSQWLFPAVALLPWPCEKILGIKQVFPREAL